MRSWLRWHRRIGISAALFVIFLSVSGLLLNHGAQLGWDRKPVTSRLLLGLYGLEAPTLASIQTGGDWITQVGGEYLFFNGEERATCRGEMAGVARLADYLVALCEQTLVLLTPTGEFVEQLDASLGLPVPVLGGRVEGGSLLLHSGQGYFLADLDRLRWPRVTDPGVVIEPAELVEPPAALAADFEAFYLGKEISVERLLFDLHSGRLFGNFGVILVDIMALLFVILAITGIWMWWRGPSR